MPRQRELWVRSPPLCGCLWQGLPHHSLSCRVEPFLEATPCANCFTCVFPVNPTNTA